MSQAPVPPLFAQGLRPGLPAESSARAVLQRGVSPGGEAVASVEGTAEVPCQRVWEGEAPGAVPAAPEAPQGPGIGF